MVVSIIFYFHPLGEMIPFDLRICFIHGFKQPPPNEAMSLKVFFFEQLPHDASIHGTIGIFRQPFTIQKFNEIQLMCRVNSSPSSPMVWVMGAETDLPGSAQAKEGP